MYTRCLQNAAHTPQVQHHFNPGASGWEVRHEQDSRVVKRVRYDDWHRVERARMAFALEAETLKRAAGTSVD